MDRMDTDNKYVYSILQRNAGLGNSVTHKVITHTLTTSASWLHFVMASYLKVKQESIYELLNL